MSLFCEASLKFISTLLLYVYIYTYVNSQWRVGSFHWTYLAGSFQPKCKSAMYSNVTQLELLTPSAYIFSVQLSKNTQIHPSNTIFNSCVVFHCVILHLTFSIFKWINFHFLPFRINILLRILICKPLWYFSWDTLLEVKLL